MRRDWPQLSGVELVPATVHADDRGTFVKLVDGSVPVGQVCVSTNVEAGTVRGMHVQVDPHPETKRLWCSSGEVFDVLVDLRPDEPTYGDWTAVHLRADEPALLTVPPGVAHGYQTLTEGAALVYLIDGVFAAGSARTLRWDDAEVGVDWPLPVTRISDADRTGHPWPLS